MSIIRSSLLLGAGDAAANGSQVSRSLRYSASDSSYLSRTPSVTGNRKTWSWSAWVKRSALGSTQALMSVEGNSDSTTAQFWFSSDDKFRFGIETADIFITNAVFRDCSAWYHFLLTFDATNATSADKIILYVNGARQTTSTYTAPSNTDYGFNRSGAIHSICRRQNNADWYFNGYVAQAQFIDGQQLTPASFAETDATTGQWIPKAYSGSYGQVSVAAATGGLPIYNTTDTYGTTKGTGTRADSNSSSIVLAVAMDGTNGGTTFTDESATIKGSGSPKSLTVSSATTSTSTSKFYGSSGNFDGVSSAKYLSFSPGTDLAFGTGDFTIEAWVNMTSRTTSNNQFVFDTSGGTQIALFQGISNGYEQPTIRIGATDVVTSTAVVVYGTWQHWAATRSGSTVRLFINGILQGTGSDSTNVTAQTTAYIGSLAGGSAPRNTNGYIQDFRIYKGVAKYTANFLPVTISNSFYLQFADNSSNTASTLGKDTSGNGNNWTPNNFSVTGGNGNYVKGVTGAQTTGEVAANLFDGNTGTYCSASTNGGTVTVTFTPSLSVTTSTRVFNGSSTLNVAVNGGTAVNYTGTGWKNVSFTGSLSSISFTHGGGAIGSLTAIEIDGVILLDNGVVGPGNDSLVDSPTNYGTDTGVGGEVRGNYATSNPLDNGGQTLANGNLDITGIASNWRGTRGTIGMSSGKWYWEVTISFTNSGSNQSLLGIATNAASISGNYASAGAYGWEYYSSSGNKFNNGSNPSYGAAYTSGDVIGIAFDADSGSLTFYKNGSSQGTAYTGLTSGPYFPSFSLYGTSLVSFNGGQRAFAYTAPSGFKALCTQNLPAPLVTKSNTVMDVALWTGDNTSPRSITGLAFNPDLVWVKERSAGTYYHRLFDSVRGTSNSLYLPGTEAENTYSSGYANVSSFDSSGFTLTNTNGGNNSAVTYVGWAWDAGTSTVSNTQGSITSQVRANATAGFSVVTYTGSGTTSTIGHGLGVAPSMIITKNRSSGSFNWGVYHAAAGNSVYGKLNLTDAFSSLPIWQNTTPSSTVFYVGNYNAANQGSDNYVAYCFAPVVGYTSMGSYTGDGSTSGFGPFIYCGFRPKFVLIKSSSVSYSWLMFDSVRNPYNLTTQVLYSDSSAAEMTNNGTGSGGYESIDILSNGFQIKSNSARYNQSGATYIYFAVAESPFNYSRAR